MTGWLIITVTAAAVLAVVLARARWWPYGRCLACRGRKRGLGSTTGAYNRCHWCGGTGERVRPLSRIYPKWRAEARRRRK